MVAPLAFGHGGEDHGAPVPTASQVVSPRATAVSDAFEMVAVLEGRKLVIYLDQFASNAPVPGARVEVEGGALKGVAKELAPGVYALDAASLPAAKYPLVISIDTADTADLMAATLDVAQPQAEVIHVHQRSEWVVWGSAGALALVGGALWRARRQRKLKEPK